MAAAASVFSRPLLLACCFIVSSSVGGGALGDAVGRRGRGGGLYTAADGSDQSSSRIGASASFGQRQGQRPCPAELDFSLHGCRCRQADGRGTLAIECDASDAEQVKILFDRIRRLRRPVE